MLKQLFLVNFITLFSVTTATGQKRPMIVYHETIHFAQSDLLAQLDGVSKNEIKQANSKDSIDKQHEEPEKDVLEFVEGFTKLSAEQLFIKHPWRNNDEVVVMEMSGPAKGERLHYYQLATQSVRFVDSFTYRLINDSVGIVTKTPSSQERVVYTVDFTKQKKNIFDYPCEKIVVTAIKKSITQQSEISKYEIWATKSIQPAIAVDGLLLFEKSLLPNYTALEVKQILPDAPMSYGLISAVGVKNSSVVN